MKDCGPITRACTFKKRELVYNRIGLSIVESQEKKAHDARP